MLRDELDLDGRPNLNLASFVGTYMEESAKQLVIENLSKNMSDADEYPAMMNMHTRCVSIIASLWGAQKGEKPVGTATTGSSEAIHLGGLAMKRRWQEKRMKEGKDTTKPNIIMGANAQVGMLKTSMVWSGYLADYVQHWKSSLDTSRSKPAFYQLARSHATV